MKRLFLLTSFVLFATVSFGQLMLSKSIGKNSSNSKLGFGSFAGYEVPINQEGTKSIRLEILDFAFFPSKNKDVNSTIMYASIKGGYKKIYSDTKTGFYIEPQAGWCRVLNYQTSTSTQDTDRDGIALAMEVGYSLEVGQRGNTFNFGLKYESDLAGGDYNAHSIGLRCSYSFHLH